jgi:transposase-like protein
MTNLRWSDGKVLCPVCGSDDVAWLPNARVYKCYQKHLKNKFSLKVGTIFEDSPIGLDKWLPVMWLLTNSRNGVSSWEIHRSMGVTQKTAWFMLQRGRLAMQDEITGGKLGGPGCEIEADESFIGGKVRNMHKDRKVRAQQAGGQKGDKTIVMGILERGGTVRTKVLDNRKRHAVETQLKAHVEPGSELYTDALQSYAFIDDFNHQVIDHACEYVRGNVHTNGMENFWSCLKRTLGGTYVSVEPFHLFRYLDEQAFRFNNRGPMTDAQRFRLVMRKIVGKRLTYAELIGKEAQTSAPDAF